MSSTLKVSVVLAVFALGCATAPVEEPTDELGAEALSEMGDETLHGLAGEPDDDGHDHEAEGDLPDSIETKAGTCNSRWSLPNATITAGSRQNVPYAGAGGRCSGGATRGAIAFADALRSRFDDQINMQVSGRGVQIYACRNVNGGSSLSVHSSGRALDIFIPTLANGVANNAKGDVIANWLVENAEHIGVQYLIWDRTQWKASGRAGERCYGGAHPHNDHIHVELSTAAAELRTPFFRDGGGNGGGEVAPPPAEQNEPPAPELGFIGDVCSANAACGTVNGTRLTCFLEHRPADGRGFCTTSCDGVCADRAGKAMTFCAEAEAVGGRSGAGLCVSKSDTENNRCRRDGGLVELSVSRFVSRSGISAANATVCAPEEVLGFVAQPPPAPRPPAEEAPPAVEPPPAANTICSDESLPMSENGLSCEGNPEGQWRCACSARFGDSVSQVCRDGAWLNYQLHPVDCDRCVGDYSGACEEG